MGVSGLLLLSLGLFAVMSGVSRYYASVVQPVPVRCRKRR
jgi:hypothetical protein